MNKTTSEEAKKALQRLSSIAYMNLEDTLLLDEYIYQTSKTPTFDDLQTMFTKEEIKNHKFRDIMELLEKVEE